MPIRPNDPPCAVCDVRPMLYRWRDGPPGEPIVHYCARCGAVYDLTGAVKPGMDPHLLPIARAFWAATGERIQRCYRNPNATPADVESEAAFDAFFVEIRKKAEAERGGATPAGDLMGLYHVVKDSDGTPRFARVLPDSGGGTLFRSLDLDPRAFPAGAAVVLVYFAPTPEGEKP